MEAGAPIDILRAFRMLGLLAVFIDAWADHNWALWETALLVDERRAGSEEREGWNDTPAKRRLREWGVVDQYGVYLLAGLTKAEQEVAYLAFDRGYVTFEEDGDLAIDAIGIGRQLDRKPTTVRAQFYRAKERLKRLAS
jgi:hypothetical protein